MTGFCCCFTGFSEVGMHYADQEGTESGHCCSTKSQSTDSKDNHECKCEKMAAILFLKGLDFSMAHNFRNKVLNEKVFFF